MSFIIQTLYESDEDKVLQSIYKQNKYCTHREVQVQSTYQIGRYCEKQEVFNQYSRYVFDVIDSHFAKQLLWQCNQREEFDMDKVTIIND